MEEAPSASSRRRAVIRRVARALLRVVLGVVALLVILTILVAYQAERLVRAGAEAEARRFGEQIGRTITVGPARVETGAVLSVELRDIRIAAAPGQAGPAAEPLFEVAAVRVRVPAWSIIRSLGKDLEVRSIEARGPVLRLVRGEGGELSYTDVVARLATTEPPPESGRRARVGRITMTGARVELHDLSRDREHGGVHLTVDRIDASVPEVRTEAPLEVVVDAAVLAPERNLHLEIGIAPRTEPNGALKHLRRVVLKLSRVVADPLVPFIPVRGGIGVAGATVSADLGLSVPPAGAFTLQASITAEAFRLSHEEDGEAKGEGSPLDVTARAEVVVDPEVPSLSVRSLSVSAGGAAVEGHADVRGPWTAPEVRDLSVETVDLTFEHLLALLPASRVPRGAVLSGPIGIRARAEGPPRAAKIQVSADLGGARVAIAGLDKPAGVALSAELTGRAVREESAPRGRLDVDALGVRLGPLSIALSGRVEGGGDADLAFDSGEVGIEPLLRLFPAVAKGVPAGTAIGGTIQAAGHLRRSGEETRGEARVGLRKAGVKAEALALEGGADLSLSLRAVPGIASLTADLAGSALGVRVPGRFEKAAGAPLLVHVAGERAGAVTTVREARLSLPGAEIAGHGRYDAASRVLKLDAPECRIDLGALSRSVPSLAQVPPGLAGAVVRTAVSFSGDPRALAGAELLLSGLSVTAPFGRLGGTLDVRGLGPVRSFDADLRGETVDLDALAGSGGRGGGAPPKVDGLDGKARIHLDGLRARGLDARDVDLEIELARGALSVPALRLSAFGGRFQAGGSRVDLSRSPPTFSLRARVEKLDLAALAALRGGSPGDLSGRLDVQVSLDGAGATFAEVSPTLTGTLDLTLDGAHVHGKRSLHAILVNPVLGKLAEMEKRKHPVREIDTHIARATVALRAGGGRVVTASPFVARTDGGALSVDVSYGFDRTLTAQGSLAIPPAAIDKATKGLLVPYGDTTVKFCVWGSTDEPRVELLDLEGTAKALRGSLAHGIEKKIDHALGKN